jgi:hypothetical protein
MEDNIDRATLGLATTLVLCVATGVCSAKDPQVRHEPQQPKSGEAVRITLELSGASAAGSCFLEYQIVDPGKYVALKDPEFQQNWTKIEMQDASPDLQRAGHHVLTARMPPELQKHRRLVRYRIRSAADNRAIAPSPDDAQPNFAYFVYDGVPTWNGAVNPKSTDQGLRLPAAYSSEALQRVAVYHFISRKSSVENATWLEPTPWEVREGRNIYKYTGTLVYEGTVYDHVSFRARGGEWRHAMGKNMWKFNFLRGHRFQARDDYGIPYPTKWDKLNLGACIQQGDTHMRGEAGMFEAVGFRLFNLAGVEAPRTHWVHLRVIDGEEENPEDQYAGDFWGLYLAVENVDGFFLKGHDLPAGNVYKIEFMQPKPEFLGNPAVPKLSDIMPFVSRLMKGAPMPVSWWQANVDLSGYYSYRSIVECIHHYDLDAGKNFFFYFNPSAKRWMVIPWDIDLTWGDHMYGHGFEPFFRTGLLQRSPCKEQYQERLAEIRDLLFNPEQVGLLIDEYARFISDGAHPSIVDADRAKWDFNPVLASPQVLLKKAGQGRFYFANPTNRFQVMVDYMKSYAGQRVAWVNQMLLADYQAPPSPQIAAEGIPQLSKGTLKLRLESKPASPVEKVNWRLAEITDPKNGLVDPHRPWKYEIQTLWSQELTQAQTVEMPTDSLVPGHIYRIRARWAQSGRWSRWSEPVQLRAEK